MSRMLVWPVLVSRVLVSRVLVSRVLVSRVLVWPVSVSVWRVPVSPEPMSRVLVSPEPVSPSPDVGDADLPVLVGRCWFAGIGGSAPAGEVITPQRGAAVQPHQQPVAEHAELLTPPPQSSPQLVDTQRAEWRV